MYKIQNSILKDLTSEIVIFEAQFFLYFEFVFDSKHNSGFKRSRVF